MALRGDGLLVAVAIGVAAIGCGSPAAEERSPAVRALPRERAPLPDVTSAPPAAGELPARLDLPALPPSEVRLPPLRGSDPAPDPQPRRFRPPEAPVDLVLSPPAEPRAAAPDVEVWVAVEPSPLRPSGGERPVVLWVRIRCLRPEGLRVGPEQVALAVGGVPCPRSLSTLLARPLVPTHLAVGTEAEGQVAFLLPAGATRATVRYLPPPPAASVRCSSGALSPSP